MTGFESAGFDHFAILLFASRPGRSSFNIRRSWCAIVGIAEAISKPGVPCQASIAGHSLGRGHRQRRPIGFAFGQQCPCDTGHLVGQRDRRDVGVDSRCNLTEPCTETGRLRVPALQHGTCSAHKQSAQ